MGKLKITLNVIVIVFAISILTTSGDARALAVDAKCQTVTAVFARGSGQVVRQNNRESEYFRDQLQKRIGKDKLNFYELGSEKYANNQYPAVNVSNVMNGNAIGAKISGGRGYDYGRSVDQGVRELRAFLTARHSKCPGEFFILGGYSQGAQVIGQALPTLPTSVKKRTIFHALFGDPVLHLPEGEGINPPACRHESLSVYRREIANCDVDNGSLGARKPYADPSDAAKTGLWCLADDFVCGSTKFFWQNDGHGKYANQDGPIEAAAREASTRLKRALEKANKNQAAKAVNDKLRNNRLGTTGTDVVFVIDVGAVASAPSMKQLRQSIKEYGATLKETNGRIGLVFFEDNRNVYYAEKVSDLQSDPTEALEKLDEFFLGYARQRRAILLATYIALTEMKWRVGAAKSVILITDVPYYIPDVSGGLTEDHIANLALKIDPVNVYPVVTENVSGQFRKLADLTSGQVVTSKDLTTVDESLKTTFDKIKNRPNAKLKIGEYRADIGQPVTFDASDSYVVDANITRYEWDFNGDNIMDKTTTEPRVTHVYNEKFDGVMQVRIFADNDTVSNMSAPVKIGIPVVKHPAPTAPIVSADIIEKKGTTATIRLSWKPTNDLAHKWVVRQNDDYLGYTLGQQTQIDITDIDISKPVTYGVMGVAEDGYSGEVGTATVPAEHNNSAAESDTTKKQCPYGLSIGRLSIKCQFEKVNIWSWSFNWVVWQFSWVR